MLKNKIIVSLSILLFLYSCGNESKSSEIPPETNVKEETPVVEETPVYIESVNVYDELSYYEEPGKGQLGLLLIGEVVSFTGNSQKDAKDNNYLEIVTKDGVTAWALEYYLFPEFKAAVIKPTEDIILFDKANENSVSDKEIEAFQIIAAKKGSGDLFTEIGWHIDNTYTVVSKKFLLASEISYQKDDILFAKVINRYLTEDNTGVKKELLETLKGLSNICNEYRKYLAELVVSVETPVLKNASEISEEYKDVITIFDNFGGLALNEESSITAKKEVDYKLLDYIILNQKYTDEGFAIALYNPTSVNITTIPGEFVLDLNDQKYYLGVLGDITIEANDQETVILNGQLPENTGEYLVSLNFINDTTVSGRNTTLGGQE